MKKIKKNHIIVFIILLVLVLIIFANKTTNNFEKQEKKVREPVVAGTWYPGTKDTLEKTIDGYFNNVKEIDFDGKIKALIVPHAGYDYSGQIAAAGFKQLERKYDTVFLLGPSHAYPLKGASILDVSHYKTPLGEVKLSDKAKEMLKEDIIDSVPDAHAKEHSLEIELPFLQEKVMFGFELVPILVGEIDSEKFKNVLLKYLGGDDLIVVSVDLSHYHPYDEAKKLDAYAVDRILKLDPEGIFRAEIDAPWAVSTLLKIAKEKEWKPLLLYYANSGDVTGDKSRVVGYSAIAFAGEDKEDELTAKEKETLLRLARDKLESIYNKKEINLDSYGLTPALKKVQGCFTTLTKHGNLRGCIGHILPQEELYKCIMDNIVSAALHDTRFNPVTQDELKDIEVEISVLSVPEKLEFSSGEDLKSKLRPLVDGVVLKKGFRQSTYLPQVWENFDNNKENFLSTLCVKGGMSANCWQDTSTEVFTYQANVFEEKPA